ncbi:hypothetical protein [Anaerolentibacter hominis]|uniref:hypothetical protein n=1 Tax=Anaerolentibacter hominis TaxID=3079009 RepID=UPI0031B7F764
MKLGTPWVSREEWEKGWADTPAGSYLIVGMDACLIPWNPLYQLMSGPHYFIVQKGKSDSHDCFDPTYNLIGQRQTTEKLIAGAYALIAIQMNPAASPLIKDTEDPFLAQAREVLKIHPETLHHFLEQSDVWMQESKETILLPGKYVDALLTGRYLYRYFLGQLGIDANRAPLFFSQQYYKRWINVKNGFYKAALAKHNSAVYYETCRLLTDLFEQELQLAGQVSSGK